jgi:prevent-host-death family protein
MARTMNAAEFKAKCLDVMEQVAATGEPVTVTKRGKPIVQVAPVVRKPLTLRGFLKGTMKITGDIVAPIDVAWDADAS